MFSPEYAPKMHQSFRIRVELIPNIHDAAAQQWRRQPRTPCPHGALCKA
jgi:hypothetical protein